MAANNKQIDSRHPDAQPSEGDFVCVNDTQVKDQTGKSKHDRKLFLLILLMLLIVSQVVVLLVNSGFINRSPEMVSVIEPEITLDDIKAVNADLNEVIKNLNEINKKPVPKDDHVEVKKVEIKPVVVPPPPVVVKEDKENIKPKQKVTENKKIALVEKVPVATAIVSAPKPNEVSVEKSIVTEVKPAYIKHDTKGHSLEDNTEQWTCVHDTSTGLMWEVKSENDAMRNSSNLYSWYNPERETLQGKADGGRCRGEADCDTHAYVQAMNKRNYCGHNDWFLPTREQMQTLVNLENGNSGITINKQYFPQTMPSWYWTSNENINSDEFAWYVLFRNGVELNDLKERPKHIRLVRVVMADQSNR